jgi:hypothetical protein
LEPVPAAARARILLCQPNVQARAGLVKGEQAPGIGDSSAS